MAQIVPTFWPQHLFKFNSNNGPSPGHSNLGSDEVYICSSFLLMIFWWLPYLAKGPTPDFNNGPGNDSNSDRILALQRLLESDLNNGPSPSHSNLVSDGVYICSGLLHMVSWWMPYLPKGYRPDFNNDLGGDSNSGPVSPGVYLSLTLIMTPSRATPILVSDQVYICSSLLFMIS